MSVKILVVDDAKAMRDLLRAILGTIDDIIVLEAENGKETMRRLRDDEDIDLVLLDIGLPDYDGKRIMKSIRKLRPELKVCFVSGERDQQVIVEAMKAGGNDFLVKPVDPTVIKEKLKKLIGIGGENVASIKADLAAEINECPLLFTLRITEISELGLVLSSELPFINGKKFTISCKGLSLYAGRDLTLRCIVDNSNPLAKKDGHLVSCSFYGLHENDRTFLRKLAISGKPLNDQQQIAS